jgi:negative regulator of sigma E activity
MGKITPISLSSKMSSDTSTAKIEDVEEGIHSSPTSQNTTETTNDDVPPSITPWWKQKRNIDLVTVMTVSMTVSIALSVGVFVSSRGNKTAKQANPLTIYSSVPLPERMAPTESTTDDECLTEADCKDQMNERYDQFVSGNYTFYGCVSKGGNLYWGAGGTVEQMTSNFPPGSVKEERVFC